MSLKQIYTADNDSILLSILEPKDFKELIRFRFDNRTAYDDGRTDCNGECNRIDDYFWKSLYDQLRWIELCKRSVVIHKALQ